MKKKMKFIIIVTVLLLITTGSLTTLFIMKSNFNKKIDITNIKGKTFKATNKTDESSSSISYYFDDSNPEGKIELQLSNFEDENEDVDTTTKFGYSLTKTDEYGYVIDVQVNGKTTLFKYKDKCIYDLSNTKMTYCEE